MCFEFPWWKEILSSFLFCFVFSLLHKWVGRKERKFSGWNCKEKKKSPTFFYFLESKVCLTSIDADTVFEFLDPLHISTSSYYKVCKILSFCFILFVGEFLSIWFFFFFKEKACQFGWFMGKPTSLKCFFVCHLSKKQHERVNHWIGFVFWDTYGELGKSLPWLMPVLGLISLQMWIQMRRIKG